MIDLTLPENAQHKADVDSLGAKGVPVIVSEFHEPILGFRPDELKALIEAYKSASHLTKNGDTTEGLAPETSAPLRTKKETDGP
jgi:hypothetical protein